MIGRYLIRCDIDRPDLPFMPIGVPCGSARTIGVAGLKSRLGVKVTGCRIRITNADGEAMVRDCKLDKGVWCVTFPASHFAHYGDVKRGVVIFAVGQDEDGNETLWVERVGDLRVSAVDASSVPGEPSEHEIGGEIYLKSKVIGGVQHYRRVVLEFSEKQGDYGFESTGDYVIVGGEYVPFGEG